MWIWLGFPRLPNPTVEDGPDLHCVRFQEPRRRETESEREREREREREIGRFHDFRSHFGCRGGVSAVVLSDGIVQLGQAQ